MRESRNFTKDQEIPTTNTIENNPILEDAPFIEPQLGLLSDYVSKREAAGEQITQEEMVNIINEFGFNVEDLLFQKIKDPEIFITDKEITSGIEEAIIQKIETQIREKQEEEKDVVLAFKNMMQEDGVDRKTALSRIRNFFGTNEKFKFNLPKAAILTLILFLKFNGAHAEGGNKKINEKK
jgi:hypothetical protein